MADATEITTCPCCGDVLSGPATAGDLCPACQQAMEAPESSASPELVLTQRPSYSVTHTLVAINVLVFIVVRVLLATGHSGAIDSLGDFGPDTLRWQWWRLLTSCFVHRETAHLLGNVLFLWILGRRAEQLWGKRSFLLVYLASGIAGSIASLAVHPEVMSYGASAGVFGLAGALISAYGLKGLKLSRRARGKLALLVAWTAYDVYPEAGSVKTDNIAHAAGLLLGLLVGGLLSSAFIAVHARRGRWLAACTELALVLGCAYVRYHSRYVVLLASATQSMDAGKTDEALRDLDVVLKQKPQSELANLLSAEAYLKKHDYPKAEAVARRVLASDGDDDRAIFLLGMAEIMTGRCQEARRMAWEKLMQHRLHSDGLSKTWSLFDAPCTGDDKENGQRKQLWNILNRRQSRRSSGKARLRLNQIVAAGCAASTYSPAPPTR